MPQTAVNLTQGSPFAGMRGDTGPARVHSYVNAEASAEIPFGSAVMQGTNPREALMPTGTPGGANLVGIVESSHAFGKDALLGSTGIKPGVNMGVMTQGVIWVATVDAVTVGGVVTVYKSGANAGKFGGALSAGVTLTLTTNVALGATGARWLTSTAGAGIAKLWFDVLQWNAARVD